MPTIPLVQKLSASSEEILNAIRNSASANYKDYVPVASISQNNIKDIGLVIMNNAVLQNEFLSALVNGVVSLFVEDVWPASIPKTTITATTHRMISRGFVFLFFAFYISQIK